MSKVNDRSCFKPLSFASDLFFAAVTEARYQKMVKKKKKVQDLGTARQCSRVVGVMFGSSVACWCAHLPDPLVVVVCHLLEIGPGPNGSHLDWDVPVPLGGPQPMTDQHGTPKGCPLSQGGTNSLEYLGF